MKDSSYSTIGYVRDDGSVQNGSHSTVGHWSIDRITDGSYSTLWNINSSGSITNSNYSTVGQLEGNWKENIKAVVAYLFFFSEL